MTIRFQAAPETVVKSIGAAFRALSHLPSTPFEMPGEAPVELLHHPHLIYDVGLKDLVLDKGLGSAKPVMWAYLVGTGRAALIAEVTHERHELSQLNQGPYATGILDAFEQAETTEQVRRGDYEFNILRIPAIYVVAIWLKDIKYGEHVFVPVAPAPRELEASRNYSEKEFFQIVRVLAARALPSNPPPLTAQ